MRILLNLLLLLGLPFAVFAQDVSSQDGVKLPQATSPNASSLGVFGQIPVSLFTGQPSISVPIYTVTEGSISVPINLSYHLASVKPDVHPGWVGQGWNLTCGGAVTRQLNGLMDEIKLAFDNPLSNDDKTILSYLEHYSLLNTNQWTNPIYINNIYQQSPHPDLEPDEFSFNFGDYSGSFYLNQQGQWKVKSNKPVQLKIDPVLTTDFVLKPLENPLTEDVILPRIFSGFTITTEDGTKYTFGIDPNAIEFSRSVAYSGYTLPYGGQLGNVPYRRNDIIPNTWMLTKVQDPQGHQINLTYVRNGATIQQTTSSYIGSIQPSGSGSVLSKVTKPSQKDVSVVVPSYLSKISTPTVTVSFTATKSVQLDYVLPPGVLTGSNGRPLDLLSSIPHQPQLASTWPKLNQVLITKGNVAVKSFSFSYKEGLGTRLTLSSVLERGANGDTLKPYRFHYNELPMPRYSSDSLDHLGYYNGRNFFTGKGAYPYSTADFQPYYDSREPDASFAIAGVLDSIAYPTGGTTRLIYEGNTYTAYASPYGPVTAVAERAMCGLRIRKIVNYSSPRRISDTKEYSYLRSDGKGSGVLGRAIQYGRQGTVPLTDGSNYDYWTLSSFPILPLSNSSGSPISYSRVVEKAVSGSQNNGYKVYNYSNYDNPVYTDDPQVYGIYHVQDNFMLDPFNSKEHERGLLLSEQTFTSADIKVKEVIYSYDHQVNSSMDTDNVRAIKLLNSNFISSQVYDARATCYLHYTNKPYLRTTDEYTYDNQGNALHTGTYNYYDNPAHGQLTRSESTSSDGSTMTELRTYAQDYPQGTGFIDDMVSSHIIGEPIEQVSYKTLGSVQKLVAGQIRTQKTGGKGLLDVVYGTDATAGTSLSQFKFSNAARGIIPISSVKSAFLQDTLYKAKYTFVSYDGLGNPTEVIPHNQPSISYKWGYNNLYLTATAKNAKPAEFYTESFEETANGSTTIAHYGNRSFVGSFAVPFTPPNNRAYVITYWYYDGTQWVFVPEQPYTGPVTLPNTNGVDDIYVYPKDAEVNAYTYVPLTGMTSTSDAKGTGNKYSYDSFQRLKYVKDQNGNILKSFDYNYTGLVPSNVAITRSLYNQTCGSSFPAATLVNYVVPDGKYTATTQAAADALAQQEANQQGQAYANANSTCLNTFYARMESVSCTIDASTSTQTCSFEIGLYADAACQTPVVLTAPMTFPYMEVKRVSSTGNPTGTVTNISHTASGAAGSSRIRVGSYVVSQCPAVSQNALKQAGAVSQVAIAPQGPPGGSNTCTQRQINLRDGEGIYIVAY